MKDRIKALIFAMAESEEVCNSVWNDVIHLDEGSDIIIAVMLTEMILQLKQSLADTETLLDNVVQTKKTIEEDLKKLEIFSEKLLTND